jgi:hypothetical protein
MVSGPEYDTVQRSFCYANITYVTEPGLWARVAYPETANCGGEVWLIQLQIVAAISEIRILILLLLQLYLSSESNLALPFSIIPGLLFIKASWVHIPVCKTSSALWMKSFCLCYKLIDLRLSLGANGCLSTQEIRNIVWSVRVCYRVHNSPPLVPILSQMTAILTCAFCLFPSDILIDGWVRTAGSYGGAEQ